MIQFGLKDLGELPSLKEFEEIRRMALNEAEPLLAEPASDPAPDAAADPAPEGDSPDPVAPPEES